MEILDTKNKFIELRAQGLSYDKIASQLQVTKQTLINWSKECNLQIVNLRKIEKEAMLERLDLSEKARLERLSIFFKKVNDELMKRDLTALPTDKLSELFIKILNLNNKIIFPIVFTAREEMNIADGLYQDNQWSED